MTNTYFSTFIAGTGEIIQELLYKEICVEKIPILLDGLIVYETKASVSNIQNIPFFNNSFLLLKSFSSLPENPIPEMMEKSFHDTNLEKTLVAKIKEKNKSFRIIASQENQTISVSSILMRNWEKKIQDLLGFSINRSKPDLEFWFLYRREGYGFFAMRLTSHTAYEKILEKGELRPELAYIMAALAQAHPEDILLDPFCGSGAIPFALALFPNKKIIASDNAKEKIHQLHLKAKLEGKKIEVQCLDALELEKVYQNQINKIITDPPWGFFSMQSIDLEEFYSKMMKSFLSILKRNGKIVALIGKKDTFEKVLAKFSLTLEIAKKYDILVSGKKAAIYVLTHYV
ncbi:MAG: methyltransferase domain-containing protein [Candidatus Brocadiae bacterium]|nr:methyltransferase domain-containing protein [Candidatus Brocadiia bacterium]